MMKFAKSAHMLLIFPLIMGLSACAKPVTRAPKLDALNVEQERLSQQKMLDQQTVKEVPVVMQPPAQVTARLAAVAPRIQKSGTEICQQMWGAGAACSFAFGQSDEDVLNAWADGKGVFITPKMVSFAASDEELANVLAHEYAHNVLKHPQSTGQNATAGALGGMLLDVLAKSQGIETGGQLSKLGGGIGQYHYSVDFEREADYVGMYILARAGYNVDGATDFWRRFTTQNPGGLYGSRSHPSNPERTLSMKKTAREITAKQQAGVVLLPNLRQK